MPSVHTVELFMMIVMCKSKMGYKGALVTICRSRYSVQSNFNVNIIMNGSRYGRDEEQGGDNTFVNK